MEPKRFWGRILFLLASALMVVFIAVANDASTRRVDCNVVNQECFAAALRALDPPLLWVLPAAAGIAGAGGAFLVGAANREPPQRATGFTWEDWETASATD